MTASPDSPASAPPGAALGGTVVFVAGAVTLALEVLAGRYLVPAFGSSVYIWGAVLSTTLACLAAGYRWGGQLADRHPRPLFRLAYHLVGAAVWIGLLPLLGSWGLAASLRAGSAVGPIVASLLLFGVPLLLLATVTPMVFGQLVRGRTDGAASLLGNLFALGTAGSVAGALVTAYLAVPVLGIGRSFFVASIVLCAVCLPVAISRTWRAGPALLLVALVALSPSAGPAALHPGVRFLERTASVYAQLDVVEDARDGTRILLLDGVSQNWVGDQGRGANRFDYGPEALAQLALHGDGGPAGPALVLGLGAGTLARDLARAGRSVEAVELDPEVIRLAVRHFDFPIGEVPVHQDDARRFVERAAAAGRRWGLIVLDVSGGGTQPPHLFTVEAFQALRRVMTATGVLVVNSIAVLSPPHDRAPRHVLATLLAVFPYVRAVDATPHFTRRRDLSNLLGFASLSPPAPPTPAHPRRQGRAYRIDPRLPALTDDWSPLDLWSSHASALWHRNMQSWLGTGVLAAH